MNDARSWDAETYHEVSSAMDAMSEQVLARLPLEGSEIVLDAGCGTGRVTAWLLDRLPTGRVLAVDADEAMVEHARRNLPTDRCEVRRQDLLDLELEQDVDAVFSTATFHWVLDHDRLFRRLFAALRPGGKLVAQCGGEGNVAKLVDVGDAVAARPPFVRWLRDFEHNWHFAGPEATAGRLHDAGFDEVRCWLEEFPVQPEDPITYLETIPLGPWLDLLPTGQHRPFVDAVASRLGTPLVVDYVRLNIDATRPA